MFLEYYGLIEQPFGVTPDPRFLYLGPAHREALASLIYGTEENRGFLALIAKPGMGKTSLLYQYLALQGSKARTAFVFQTDCDSREFLRHILMDLGLDVSGKDLPAMHGMFNLLLTDEMRAGRRFILVIDEAQNLEEKVLESVRLLSNFETPWMKLMQIVIAGQPQLADRLSQPSMAQLRQRISMVVRVAPLTPSETTAYIEHRLRGGGYDGPSLFTIGARILIAQHSRGIPRNINNICFNAMSLGCALGQKTIDRKIILEVLKDLDLESLKEENSLISKPGEMGEDKPLKVPAVAIRAPWISGWISRVAATFALLLIWCLFVVPLNSGEIQRADGRTTDGGETRAVITAPSAGNTESGRAASVRIAPWTAGADGR